MNTRNWQRILVVNKAHIGVAALVERHGARAAVVAFVILVSSCASVLKPKIQDVAVSTYPLDAAVFVNNQSVGKGSTVLKLDPKAAVIVECRSPGYATMSRVLVPQIQGVWVLASALSGFIPVIIDAATGNWNSLEPKAVNCYLARDGVRAQ